MKYNILISSPTGDGDNGDEAILRCVTEQIKEALDDECEFTVFSNDPRISSEYNTGIKYIYSGRHGFNQPGKDKKYSKKWIKEMLSAIKKCDIFITGGGTVLQDSTNKFFVPFWFAKIIIAQFFRKPTMMYGIGAGPLKRKSSKFLMNTFGKKIKAISVRGPYSYEWITGFKKINKENVYIAADPAVTLKNSTENKVEDMLCKENIILDSQKNLIVVSVREWFRKKGKGAFFESEIDNEKRYDKYVEDMGLSLIKLIEDHNSQILLLPMTVNDSNDVLTGERIWKYITDKGYGEQAFVVRDVYDPSVFRKVIGRAKLVISVRFHPLVYATMQGVKSVGIGYGNKTKDYMTYIGLEEYSIPIEEIDCRNLTEMYEKAINDEEYAKKLQKAIPIQLEKAKLSAQIVKDLLKEKVNG